MSADYAVCGGCGQVNACSCPKPVPAKQSLAELLHWRFTELSEHTKYVGDDWEACYNAISALRALLARHYPLTDRHGRELVVHPDHLKHLLPEVPNPEGCINAYNMVKDRIAVLLDAIRWHVTAPDFLEAAAILKNMADLYKKHNYKLDPMYCYR